ncbi:LacI family DNA-binding transcriptional regulator [Streptomyces variabilis]
MSTGSVTIQQVAVAAAVSPSTVSNYLIGRHDRMRPETQQRIAAAIAELGYRPNRAARQLRTGRVQAMGLLVPSVANPFWGAFALHLESVALTAGYRILLCNSARSPEREMAYVEQLWDDGIRGIVLCSSLPNLDHLAPWLEQGLNLVAFDRTVQAGDPPTLVNIGVDNAIAAQLATRHLWELGHRRLAFVSGSLNSVSRSERFRGFANELAAHQMPVDEALVWSGRDTGHYGDPDLAGLGRTAVTELLATDDPPTAVVAVNDVCALGVAAGIRDAGLRVGQDVSVTGFDDIDFSELAVPPLTTVRQPLADLAATTFKTLRERIDSERPLSGCSLLMHPELVVRASTGPPRRTRGHRR